MQRTLIILFSLLPASLTRAEEKSDPVNPAIEKALRRIEQGAANYPKHRECFSCHHQALAILSLSSARTHGFRVEKENLQEQIDFTLKSYKPKLTSIPSGKKLDGANTEAVYALYALDAAKHPADETTKALVQFLLARQKSDGSWPAITKRLPLEGSAFTNTALAIKELEAYGPSKDDKDAHELRERIAKARDIGLDWLLENKPADTEDKVGRLRGLVWAGADKKVIDSATEALKKEQKENGGWAQLPDMESDAYATATVLLALRVAGLAVTDSVYQKGVSYLVKTQKDDGGWIVKTRSRPVQTFFDNGDPGGKSQFISFTATNWAVLALMETLPTK